MVGQEHVLKALINALDHERLHHAYLFTGTRGVGKTTVARVLAKCLNCETGIVSAPCGTCDSCTEIDSGRFVDLIEVDAASRTKVEDTRELLDNVQYSPTRGRFKIYLIDEVHMLSNSSFNALLKTLEEPPPHVKFLLATTDPQKLPATILSRCLQFNLKNMSPEKIVSHLQNVLREEMVPFEEKALWQLARGADGSMRDALSLTDQAIAFGNGKLIEHDVANMLGTIDNSFIQKVVEALISQDGAKLLQAVADFAELSPDYSAALADLQALLHRIAIAQALPDALDNSFGDRQQILSFATQVAPEDIQLFYQIALMGQKDIELSLVARTAFEMTLLRMLAFKPQGVADVPTQTLSQEAAPAPVQSAPAMPAQEHSVEPETQQTAEYQNPVSTLESSTDQADSREAPQKDIARDIAAAPSHEQQPIERPVQAEQVPEKKSEVLTDSQHAAQPSREPVEIENLETASPATVNQVEELPPSANFEAFQRSAWPELFQALPIQGVLRLIASNLQCVKVDTQMLVFKLDEISSATFNKEHINQLAEALTAFFGSEIAVEINIAALDQADGETPSQRRNRLRAERRQAAMDDLKQDPIVLNLQQAFGAQIKEDSIEIDEVRQ